MAHRARQLDPLSPIIGAQQAQAYSVAHQFDKAIELYSKLIAENPTFGRAHSEMAYAYWGEHKYADAIREWKLGSQLEGDKNYINWADNLDAAFATGGWPAAVRRGIEIDLASWKTKAGYVSAYQIAALYADIGDKEHAFQWLNTAYESRDNSIIDIRTDWAFDSVRSDPRYAELIHKIGLPE
jgi:tetratricopeptide (TPR) repeat protein